MGVDRRRRGRPTEVHLAQRRVKVVTMRAKGATYREIAAEVKVSPATVVKDVSEACRRLAEEEYASTQQLRTQTALLLDGLLSEWVERARDDPVALDRVLRIIEARRRLFGLDAPQEVSLVEDGTSVRVEFIEPPDPPRLTVVEGRAEK